MISIFISLIGGILCGTLYSLTDKDASFGIYFCGIIGTAITFYIVNKWKQKPLNVVMQRVQGRLMQLQEAQQKKVNHFQSRPGGNQAAFMKGLEKMQKEATGEAIEMLKDAEPFYKWNFLIEKQVNTMRFQLNFQIKNLEEADKYIDKIWLMDPSVATMKMARLYKKDPIDRSLLKDAASKKKALKNWSVTKAFNKGIGRVKGANAVLIYSTYCWMLVKLGLVDEALALMTEAHKKTGDDIVAQNLDRLRNDKPNSYSNAKYGERWYALYLEEPPKQKPKVVRQKGNRQGGRPF